MSVDVDTLKTQILELQSQLAFQEDAVQSLDRALAQQQDEILVMRRQLELLRQDQLQQTAGNGASPNGNPANEPPPHY
ncbi:MAG: SlyX family protein [Halioglobus sp.]|nr:SlyX family protein [Halioglobus sp.]